MTHHNISCLSQLYKLIISRVASGQSVTKHLDYLWHELGGGDFNLSQAHEIKLGLLEKIRSGLQISLKMTHFGPICRQNTVVTHSRQKSLNLPPQKYLK